MDDDITLTLKRSNDLLMMCSNDYSDVFLPAIDEIERLREALRFYAEWGIDAGDKARIALGLDLNNE